MLYLFLLEGFLINHRSVAHSDPLIYQCIAVKSSYSFRKIHGFHLGKHSLEELVVSRCRHLTTRARSAAFTDRRIFH